MSLRQRILLAVVGPSVALLAVFSALVFVEVRAERLADLDHDLSGRAAAISNTVEFDEGWELDPPPPDLVEPLSGWQVRADEGLLIDEGEPLGRRWSGRFPVESVDHPREVEVVVWQDDGPVHRDLRTLLIEMAALGLGLSGLALLSGGLLSRKIVDEEAHHQLQEAMSRQARFTADAAHELRTPLAVMRSAAEVALRREREPAQYREALSGVLSGATRMQGLLEGLLLLARADAGVELEPVDLALLGREAVDERGDPRVQVQSPPSAPARGAPELLRAVVDNLLSNALRYSEGPVTLRLSPGPQTWVIEVEDQGPGIPPDQLEAVFERFHRLDEARSRAEGGAGLGLSVVRRVTELHGGAVSLRSAPGQGTTARVELPRGR
ncbi:MAG: HAMP domain-containing histidine kinase [Alphaproteobacteria bacterium]|nr:HAMP domain-containing histidine kinase [Alphaproteobacteria bacterium]